MPATMPDLDQAYETDNISITSTASSSKQVDYPAKAILSERPLDSNGDNWEYLIEWEDYPIHRCTWEPEAHLEGTNLLEVWANQQKRLGEDVHQEHMIQNEAKFEAAVEQYHLAKAHRQALRKKKRENLRKRARPILIVSSSESEENTTQSLQRPKKKKRKKQEKSLATSLEEGEWDDSSQLDSLFIDPQDTLSPGRDFSQQVHKSASLSDSAPTARKAPLQQSDSSSSAASGGDPVQNSHDSHRGRLLSKNSFRGKGQTNDVEPARQVPSAQSAGTPPVKPSNSNSMKRTEPSKNSSGIKIVNQPKTQSTPWQKCDKPFSTLKFRRNAIKRSQIEGTPEIEALSFIGAAPPGLTAAKPRTSNDDIYGRREAGARRRQDVDMESDSRRASIDGAGSLETWETEKVPMVCYEWRMSSNCKFGDRKCRFLHRNQSPSGRALPLAPENGNVIPKFQKPPVTCRFWLLDPHGCRKTNKECIYAHNNTGYVLYEGRHIPDSVDPTLKPASEEAISKQSLTCGFWLFDPAGCKKSDEQCRYAHKNTGRVADRNRQNEGTVVDITLKPVSASSSSTSTRPPQNAQQQNLRPSELTCFFWVNGRCNRRDDKCHYKHWHTGIVADPPPSALTCQQWADGKRCPANNCKFAHKYTGFMSDQYPRKSNPHAQVEHETPRQVALPETSRATDDVAASSDSQAVVSEKSSFPPPSVTFKEKEEANHRFPPSLEITQADTICSTLQSNIERDFKLNFLDLFTSNDGSALLDRRAFLLYHPEHHLEELDLLTRWLLMHHVEVGSAWYDGSWNSFQQHLLEGGSGVIIAHPGFEYFTKLAGFGRLLEKQVRVWSIGMQGDVKHDANVYDSPAALRQDCKEIFPHGGFIYITDEVFEKEPQLAFKIVQRFSEKIAQLRLLGTPVSPRQIEDDACVLWRLCVRPQLAEHLFQKCEERAEELDAGEEDVTSLAKLYTILAEHNLIDMSDSSQPFSPTSDQYPILSERRVIAEEAPLEYFATLARSQEAANFRMIHYYALLQADLRREYRHFFVVHTDPSAAYVEQWEDEVQTIAAVITPATCLEELEKEGGGGASRLDFLARYLPDSLDSRRNGQSVTQTAAAQGGGENHPSSAGGEVPVPQA